jgi:hypothetical protein
VTVYVHLNGVLRYANQQAARDAQQWAAAWAQTNDARLYKSPTVKPIADLHTIPATDDGGCTREVTLDVWVMFPDLTIADDLEPLYNEIRQGIYLTTGCGSTIGMTGQDAAPTEQGG